MMKTKTQRLVYPRNFLVTTIMLMLLTGCNLGSSTQPVAEPSLEATDAVVNEQPALEQNGVIAFLSTRDGDLEVFTVLPDGSAVSKISDNEVDDLYPSWSPDGSQLAFMPGGETGEYLIVDAACAYLSSGCAKPPETSSLGVFPSFEWDTHYQPGADATGYLYSADLQSAGNKDIYVEYTSGSPQALTNDPAQDDFPAWSKGGSMIAFSSTRGGADYEIFVMNADGSNLAQLTNNDTDDMMPTWSPDGTQIAFMAYRGNWEIYVIGVDGSGEKNLSNDPADDTVPVWSPRPDVVEMIIENSGITPSVPAEISITPLAPPLVGLSGHIVFSSDRDGNLEIYSMNAGGGELIRLTDDPQSDNQPVWSPDGSKIAFTSRRDELDPELYVMNADGTEVFRLTYSQGFEAGPVWSADGTKIAFESTASTSSRVTDIYVINVDGTNQINLSNSPNNNDFGARWDRDSPNILHFTTDSSERTISVDVETGTTGYQPDTYQWTPVFSPFNEMVYLEEIGERMDIFLWRGADVEGLNLTNHPAHDYGPSWSLDGQYIVFETDRDGNVEIYIVDRTGKTLVNITNNPAVDSFPNWGP